jgi:hypothetical protein
VDPERLVVAVDVVAQGVRVTDQFALDYLEGDIDHVVCEPATVRVTGVVSADDTEGGVRPARA